MLVDKRFIIISGTSRNVGKTTLACRMIQYLVSQKRKVISAKLITLKEGKESFPHTHHNDIDTFEIIRDHSLSSRKDTSKMLLSGAEASYLVVSKEDCINNAVKEFLSLIPEDTLIVVESASLRNYIKPLIFIVVDRIGVANRKPYIKKLIPLADFVIDDALEDGLCDKICKI